jgi:hypothetical protein
MPHRKRDREKGRKHEPWQEAQSSRGALAPLGQGRLDTYMDGHWPKLGPIC